MEERVPEAPAGKNDASDSRTRELIRQGIR